MNAHDLLGRLRRNGVRVSLEGDGLKVRAGAGKVSPQDRDELLRARSEVLALLQSESEHRVVQPLTDERDAVLSVEQEHLWVLSELAPDTAGFNIPLVLRIAGRLDEERLGQALHDLGERHQQLRLVLHERGGGFDL